MRRVSAIAALSSLAAIFACSLAYAADQGESEKPSATEDKKPELTAEEKAEKEIRKICKAKVCGIIDSKDPAGEDITCDIVRTWRQAEIARKLDNRIDWPWGKARCEARVMLKREPLAKAMSETSYEIALPSQTIRCTLDQKAGGAPFKVEIALAPNVKFENGKAIDAKINWGNVSGPMLVYPLLYAATGFDNANNVLGPEIVRMVNEFRTKKCAELKQQAEPKQD